MQSAKTTPAIVTLGLFAVLAAAGASGDTIYVDASATGANDGSSWPDAFTDLQDALDAATSGDEIWVAAADPPYYRPSEETDPGDPRSATFQLLNGVAIYGGFEGADSITYPGGETGREQRDPEANETVLSGDLNGDDGTFLLKQFTASFSGSGVPLKPRSEAFDLDGDNDVDKDDFAAFLEANNYSANSYHVVTGSGTDETAILDGFTITAGRAAYPADHRGGGGMYNEGGSPTLINCMFSGNFASGPEGYGGGMYNALGSPTLTKCTFRSCGTGFYGGGMYNASGSPALTNCTFNDNSGYDDGGGMVIESGSPRLINCTFSGNYAMALGGGIDNSGSPSLTNCVFSGNVVDFRGGAVYNDGGSPRLTNCIFSGNSADYGGGMCISDGNPEVTNCIFWGNSAAYSGGTDESAQIHVITGTPVVSYSCIQGCDTFCADPNDHNIGDDPLFVRDPDPGPDGRWCTEDDDYGDLHLQPGSLCIDAGTNTPPGGLPDTDLDGNPRIVNGRVDMGAYESQPVALALDVLPSDCPNRFTINPKMKRKTKLPMAILGSEDFDACEIDTDTISIANVVFPLKTPSADKDENGDGFNDLVIHVSRRDLIQALGLDAADPGTVVPITVKGHLKDGTPFEATDSIELVARD